MSKNSIFISYSRKDLEFVKKLSKSLRKKGVNAWYDRELLSGEEWDDALEKQIIANDHLIIVLSESSVASDNVKNEMRYALDLGKDIHPVLIEECSVPLSMRRMHYIDFQALGYNNGIKQLMEDIKNKQAQRKKEGASKKKGGRSKSKLFLLVLLLAAGYLGYQYQDELIELFKGFTGKKEAVIDAEEVENVMETETIPTTQDIEENDSVTGQNATDSMDNIGEMEVVNSFVVKVMNSSESPAFFRVNYKDDNLDNKEFQTDYIDYDEEDIIEVPKTATDIYITIISEGIEEIQDVVVDSNICFEILEREILKCSSL